MNGAPGIKGGPARYKVLVVAMHNSVHTARWLTIASDPDIAYLVVPVYSQGKSRLVGAQTLSFDQVNPCLPGGTWLLDPHEITSLRTRLIDLWHRYVPWHHAFVTKQLTSPARLEQLIKRFQPDLIHSMEVQLAGYLCWETARRMKRTFPLWMLSNWGSDFYLFRKLSAHANMIRNVVERMDLYLAECARDHDIARDLGYRGPALETIPASGGMDFTSGPLAAAKSQPSRRTRIMVKGYHGWSGRALTALSAVRLAAPALHDFTIVVQSTSPVVARECERLVAEEGLTIVQRKSTASHAKFIAELSRCRVLLSIGISDGISTTMLEALAVGAFPIQSDTACADEWFEHGRTGFIVPPHDTRKIADALRKAVADDGLVNRAAPINRDTVAQRWNADINGERIRRLYRSSILQGRTS